MNELMSWYLGELSFRRLMTLTSSLGTGGLPGSAVPVDELGGVRVTLGWRGGEPPPAR